MEKYGHDETEDIYIAPSVVLRPSDTAEVSSIMQYCHERNLPVTPSGARTGLSGGAIPVFGGVALSMERFNRILLIDEKNHQVVTEPGVITQVLQEAVKEKGLFYPPDPASKGSCFIGGNIAENSGGPKAVKYGVTKDYVWKLYCRMEQSFGRVRMSSKMPPDTTLHNWWSVRKERSEW